MDATQPIQSSPDPDGDNPLQFWVAYLPGEADKKNYLSDGEGNLRVFKSEGALRDYLKPQLRPEVYARVVVHQVQGQIALPDDGTLGTPLPAPRRIPEIIPLDIWTPSRKPITTLAPPTVPTAHEQLDGYVKRRRRRRRN